MNENFIREQGNSWKKIKEVMFGTRGIWRLKIDNDNSYLKANLMK